MYLMEMMDGFFLAIYFQIPVFEKVCDIPLSSVSTFSFVI